VNKIGDADSGYIPRSEIRKLDISQIEINAGRNILDIQIPCDRKGLPRIGPSVLVDYDSMKIIWGFRANEIGQIASMTKMMLMFVTFALADSGVFSLLDTVKVTDEAPLMGGSQAYLDRGEEYTISQLLSGIAVCSANDAAYLLAQFISGGDISKTIELMNNFGTRLGLKNTKFYNAHGLPPARSGKDIADGVAIQKYKKRNIYVAKKPNKSTPIEMAKLAVAFCRYPRLLLYTNISIDSLWDANMERPFGPYLMNNHFKAVKDPYIDGIKTGYTVGAGYCVTASAIKNGRRLIAVVFDAQTQDLRDNFIRKLFDTAFDSLGIKDSLTDTISTSESK
jgi:D-alanyl-D-alanine carboxypeptidase (penicillin-binding protein 5/6)